ncbi:MAG: hypothetical protein R2855_14000 [Thermomicrobiales bacterium]
MVAAVAALLATLLEPVLQAQFPPSVSPNQPFPKPSPGFPNPWWLRPAGPAVRVAALGVMHFYRKKDARKPIGLVGALGALAALLGLALTTHAAAQEDWNLAGKLSVSLYGSPVGLVGGLILLGVCLASRRACGRRDVRQGCAA